MRFPGEDVSRLTMQQLRGREGSRVRSVYRKCSKEYGVEWNGRSYHPGEPGFGDPVNRALTIANSCLYGITYSIIVSMGCSPGLGFVHTGHERSFVYDVSDLYKTEVTVPIAFEVASSMPDNLERTVRYRMREAVVKTKLIERMVNDLRNLLSCNDEPVDVDVLGFWNNDGTVSECGFNYGESGR